METTKGIDQDVATLHSELARHDGKFQFHCTKRCKYLVAVVGLLLLMFLFGMLTRSTPDIVTVEETTAVLDTQAPRIVQPELNTRLATLFQNSTLPGALFPTLSSTATAPAILTWTPQSVGRVHKDGSVVPLSGSYVIPKGWFGAIRLTADGEEIGSTYVDSRTLASPAGVGRFTMTPTAITGERLIHISFDAVKACRLTCAVGDQVCMLTNPNYCVPQSDNQSFLTYTPTMAEALPPAGSCIEKTFVSGPKYAPQIPEDYTMCSKGMWNEPVMASYRQWAIKLPGISSADRAKDAAQVSNTYVPFVNQYVLWGVAHQSDVTLSDDLSVSLSYFPGSEEEKQACVVSMTVRKNCN